mmetsp:Transcript_12290/g.22091  ORF Transcript_12290/g.22091 Transcript_12290/m.22091 type:complete len:650 (-) Transcript_12290:94-2043(-)
MTFDALATPPAWASSLIAHCDWATRARLLQLSRSWRLGLASSHCFWRQCCVDLARERRLYLTPYTDHVLDWHTLFMELWGRRGLWLQPADEVSPIWPLDHLTETSQPTDEELTPQLHLEQEQFRFTIRVCARFRAFPTTESSPYANHGATLVLPFHQRVEMIKARYPGSLSNSGAARILMHEMGREPCDPWAEAELSEEVVAQGLDTDAVGYEEAASGWVLTGRDHKASIMSVKGGPRGTVLAVAPGCGLREFTFSSVFGQDARQDDVYASVVAPLVADFVNGFNGTLLVYGQTGSGKTYTMFGPHVGRGDTCITGTQRGMVPRAFEEVLTAVVDRREFGLEVNLAMSYVEVFGQEMFDLLREGAPVGQSRVAGQRYVLDGGCSESVDSLDKVDELLLRGEEQKRRAATAMNERSTRAHAVVVLSLRQTDSDTGVTHVSHLFLVDLGGSEQLSKSGAAEMAKDAGTTSWAEYYKARERLVEATNINQGLFALKKCIDALNSRAPYVPYQDSKLTQLLSGALGGDSRTVVVITGRLEIANALETVQALRFGERCATVENSATFAGAALAGALANLAVEIDSTETLIREKERWETRTVVRQDAEDGDETVKVSVLAGAEEERARLEQLLWRRRQLLGEPEPTAHYSDAGKQ